MFELNQLLNRKTVKNFLAEKVPEQILGNAAQVAWCAPTSLNSRPTILLDISRRSNDDWINFQPAAESAPHLFIFAASPEAGEANARKFLSQRFSLPEDDQKVSARFAEIVKNREEWTRQQLYLTAGYFAATLEASGVSGCFIAGFDKKIATEKLKLPPGYTAELIFACGFANPKNDGSTETDFVRKFDDFYFPESAVS
ncbi:MAG: nitroreductase family protein [Patescibacteria group bacterium]